jgi:hypothetical protein
MRGRPERDLHLGMPGYRLARYLRDLRQQAGNPTYRYMADRPMSLGSLWRSASTMSRAASGSPVRHWDVVAAYLAALGYEPDSHAWATAEELWRLSRRRLPTPNPDIAATMTDLGRMVGAVIRSAERQSKSRVTGLPRSTIHGIITGKWLPTRHQLRRILEASGMPADQIEDWIGCRDRLFRARLRGGLTKWRRRQAYAYQRISI